MNQNEKNKAANMRALFDMCIPKAVGNFEPPRVMIQLSEEEKKGSEDENQIDSGAKNFKPPYAEAIQCNAIDEYMSENERMRAKTFYKEM